jgi:hypothetical protein
VFSTVIAKTVLDDKQAIFFVLLPLADMTSYAAKTRHLVLERLTSLQSVHG